MSESERSFFEPRFGVDFSNVRVHNDTREASVTRSVNACAFTLGRNVVFGAGEYSLNVSSGKKLLAHELTHVVQQNGAPTLFSTGKNSENTTPNSQELSVVFPEFSQRKPIQRQEEEEDEKLQTKRDVRSGIPVIPNVERRINTMRGGGQPLPEHVRAFFEPRFNRDFSQVRVHADTSAADISRALNAQAFTHKQDVFFGSGTYAPEMHEGKRLLAHELTHVVQQVGSRQLSSSHGTSDSIVMRTIEARRAEIESAVNAIESIVNPISEIGAQVDFLFWTSGGAVTMVSHRRAAIGRGRGTSISGSSLRRRLTTQLTSFVASHERHIQLRLIRQRRRWQISSTREVRPSREPARPPEGRTLPLSTVGYSADTFSRVVQATSQILQTLATNLHGTSRYTITMDMDDDRLDLSSVTLSVSRRSRIAARGVLYRPDPSFETSIVNALLPLTRGLGRRNIRLVLVGRHSGARRFSDWRVEEAEVVRPQVQTMGEAEAIVAEYRATHERIIRQWREGVRDAAIYVAMLGARELALWLIGGAVFRVFGALFRGAAPVLMRLIRGRTAASTGFLETLIVRLAPAEKAQLRTLVTRAETQGIETLSRAERAQLRAIMQRLEGLVSSALTRSEKRRIRAAMVARFRGAHEGAAAAFSTAGRAYQIHHRIPLEWSHLFRGFDVNAGRNLIGLDTIVHRGVNAVWTRFRTAPASRVTRRHVERVAQIVDRHFRRWYQRPPNATGLAARVEAATSAARREVDTLLQAF